MRSTSLSPLRRRLRLATMLGAATVAVSAVGASSAQAAFTTSQCQGDPVAGSGASFANVAHQGTFIPRFTNIFCLGSAPVVTYGSGGSGKGRRVVGERTAGNITPGHPDNNLDGSRSRLGSTLGERWGMTDEPLTAQAKSEINQGTDAAGDEGLIHQIPMAVGNVNLLVNWPDSCSRANIADGRETDAGNAGGYNRIKFSRQEVERVFRDAGGTDADQWEDIFPELDGVAGCDNLPLFRVHRRDSSGTTFVWKDYLDAIRPATGWLTTYIDPNPTIKDRLWPNCPSTLGGSGDGVGGTYDPATNAFAPTDSNCVSHVSSNGNPGVRDVVTDLDGSIGYVVLADLRTPTTINAKTGQGDATKGPDVFFPPLQNGDDAYVEATAETANGWKPLTEGGVKGANCETSQFRNTPANTLGNWEPVSGIHGADGGAQGPSNAFPTCSFTYGLFFDDNAAAYGSVAAEERKARTVKDYVNSSLTPGTQGALLAGDYSPLPASTLAVAQAGANSIGWNKAGDNPGGPGPGPAPGPGGGGGGGGGGAPPSNAFSTSSTKARSSGVTTTLRVPGKGNVVQTGTANLPKARAAARKVVCSVQKRASAAGSVRVTCKFNRAGKKALRKVRKLKVSLRTTFTPDGGSPRTVTKSVSVKGKKRK